MPLNEIERHPFLYRQVEDFHNQASLSKYCKLIVGTFPIYAITESDPIENIGLQLRENWFDIAFIQYFYGSRMNYFWELFCSTFDEELPNNLFDAIELLDKYGFLITDVFSHAARLNFSSLDNQLVTPILNESIIDIVQNSDNLQIVYFTSKIAKKAFCRILQIHYIDDYDHIQSIRGKNLRLIILISPAGNGRTVWHFRNHFPLLQEEVNNRQNGNGYAIAYRQRYYTNFLTIRCN